MESMQPQRLSIQDARIIVRRFRFVAGFAVLILTVGTVFYHFQEQWRWIDSLYFSVVSLLTVGYGDFTPQTDLGKLFTVFYLLAGIGVLAALANNIIKGAVARRHLKKHDK